MPKNKVPVLVLFIARKCIFLEFDAFAYLSTVTHTLILWFILTPFLGMSSSELEAALQQEGVSLRARWEEWLFSWIFKIGSPNFTSIPSWGQAPLSTTNTHTTTITSYPRPLQLLSFTSLPLAWVSKNSQINNYIPCAQLQSFTPSRKPHHPT